MSAARLLPPPLAPGDPLGIIAPAGQLRDQSLFDRGVALLSDMGFKVKYPKTLWPGKSYLSDSDKGRADEFNRLILDTEIKGLICMRGGYGALRILDGIDFKEVRNNPKIIVGFSDISLLLNVLYNRTGLVSLHGPVVTSLPEATAESRERLKHSLSEGIGSPIHLEQLEIVQDGPSAKGPIIGGNLASLVTLLGTGYDFCWKNCVVVLEDVDEPLYKVDRMLSQLRLAGKFQGVAGIVLGDFSMGEGFETQKQLQHQYDIRELVLSTVANRDVPIWANFPCGHCPHNLSFPLGMTAEMNRVDQTICFS